MLSDNRFFSKRGSDPVAFINYYKLLGVKQSATHKVIVTTAQPIILKYNVIVELVTHGGELSSEQEVLSCPKLRQAYDTKYFTKLFPNGVPPASHSKSCEADLLEDIVVATALAYSTNSERSHSWLIRLKEIQRIFGDSLNDHPLRVARWPRNKFIAGMKKELAAGPANLSMALKYYYACIKCFHRFDSSDIDEFLEKTIELLQPEQKMQACFTWYDVYYALNSCDRPFNWHGKMEKRVFTALDFYANSNISSKEVSKSVVDIITSLIVNAHFYDLKDKADRIIPALQRCRKLEVITGDSYYLLAANIYYSSQDGNCKMDELAQANGSPLTPVQKIQVYFAWYQRHYALDYRARPYKG